MSLFFKHRTVRPFHSNRTQEGRQTAGIDENMDLRNWQRSARSFHKNIDQNLDLIYEGKAFPLIPTSPRIRKIRIVDLF